MNIPVIVKIFTKFLTTKIWSYTVYVSKHTVRTACPVILCVFWDSLISTLPMHRIIGRQGVSGSQDAIATWQISLTPHPPLSTSHVGLQNTSPLNGLKSHWVPGSHGFSSQGSAGGIFAFRVNGLRQAIHVISSSSTGF